VLSPGEQTSTKNFPVYKEQRYHSLLEPGPRRAIQGGLLKESGLEGNHTGVIF